MKGFATGNDRSEDLQPMRVQDVEEMEEYVVTPTVEQSANMAVKKDLHAILCIHTCRYMNI